MTRTPTGNILRVGMGKRMVGLFIFSQENGILCVWEGESQFLLPQFCGSDADPKPQMVGFWGQII